jgi:hypothetical protein
MKPSVAPIMRATSISADCAMTCRRMVLKVTATRPAAKSPASIHKSQLAEAQEGIEALDPGRIELDMRDLGPAGDFLAQDLQCLRFGVGRLDDEGIGQRIARQAGDDLGHAFALLHALQRLFLRHEAPLAAGRLTQAGFDLADILLARLEDS